LRPAFSENGEILAFAMVHELQIKFDTSTGHSELLFGLDPDDLRALRDVIDSAIRNEEVLDSANMMAEIRKTDE
jgi:hypothetical protein